LPGSLVKSPQMLLSVGFSFHASLVCPRG